MFYFLSEIVQRAEIMGLLMNVSEEAILGYQVSLNIFSYKQK